MQATVFQHRMAGGAPTRAHRWLPDTSPRAVVQVVHGMAEHGARYARLAEALTAAGIAVYVHDLPGHGPDARRQGHFGDVRGWRTACASIRELQKLIQREQPGVPCILLGHSMGSYLAQHYVADFGSTLAGVVLSATVGEFGPRWRVALALVRAEALVYGLHRPSRVGTKLSFGSFNRGIPRPRTAFDWLSRDPAEVDKYVADPLCGFACTTGLWIDLLQAALKLGAPQRMRRVPRALPVLVIGGARDPATGGEAGPRALERNWRKAGVSDITVKIYPEARHELFNDTCRDEVTRDLVQWLGARATR